MSTGKINHLLSENQLEQVALRFRLLGEPMRLRILQAVCRQPHTVNEIVTAVGATQANVSKHLALLAGAGILERQKEGQRVFYGMKDQLALKLCELVHKHLSPGTPISSAPFRKLP
jgi:DNA-binding transcriptional ArsR family regulator